MCGLIQFYRKRQNLHTVYLVKSLKSIPLSVALLFKIHHDIANCCINEFFQTTHVVNVFLLHIFFKV